MTKFSRVSLFANSNVTVYPRLVDRKTKIARNYLDHQEKKVPELLRNVVNPCRVYQESHYF